MDCRHRLVCKNVLAVGGVGSVGDGAHVLGRVLGVAGVLSDENNTAVLRSLETESLFNSVNSIHPRSIQTAPDCSSRGINPAYLLVGVSSVLANSCQPFFVSSTYTLRYGMVYCSSRMNKYLAGVDVGKVQGVAGESHTTSIVALDEESVLVACNNHSLV